ncbi:MAG: MCE family protein [Bdellovibrionaceae bacterium]|nr:MCE family protein [Bdellovibrionales bacterium]MCB9085330.1 MCE family protein [Pseudobdellovibrionaceae bacterium]
MKAETKVGILFLVAIAMVVAFAYFLGAFNPFASSNQLTIAYNFAGGIEVGSPVRVMGIKVGKVKSIDFDPDLKMPDGEEVKLKVKITVDPGAWKTVREDSKFFINLAGVIGEKFIEITPGSSDKSELQPGDLVRGEDPPRIDQLISQSYGLAGKVIEFVEKNEGSVIETIEMMNRLVTNLNATLKMLDKATRNKDAEKLVKNLVTLSDDMAYFTQQLRTSDGEKTLKLMKDLIWRLDDLDKKAIKKFLQEEGIKAKLF